MIAARGPAQAAAAVGRDVHPFHSPLPSRTIEGTQPRAPYPYPARITARPRARVVAGQGRSSGQSPEAQRLGDQGRVFAEQDAPLCQVLRRVAGTIQHQSILQFGFPQVQSCHSSIRHAPAPAQDRLAPSRTDADASRQRASPRCACGCAALRVKLLWPLLVKPPRRRARASAPSPIPRRARPCSIRARAGGLEGEFSQPYDDSIRATPLAPNRCCWPASRPARSERPPGGRDSPSKCQGGLSPRTCCYIGMPPLQAAVKKRLGQELTAGVEPQDAQPDRPANH